LTSPADAFYQRTIAEVRANHGRVGGNFAGTPLLLLHTTGYCCTPPAPATGSHGSTR